MKMKKQRYHMILDSQNGKNDKDLISIRLYIKIKITCLFSRIK